jgi:hypothetical protein
LILRRDGKTRSRDKRGETEDDSHGTSQELEPIL